MPSPVAHMTPSERLKEIQKNVLRWFQRNTRELPWRKRRDPYAIWVAEIMLQQTRSGAVGPYYKRFLKRFPTVQGLAAAPVGDVLKVWEGLGYYARARNMHRAAKQIVRDFGGRLPQTAAELRTLPGIGRYTAGAIASIAFDADEPVLDGNVTRVLSRLFRIRENPRTAKNQQRLWSLAQKLIPRGKARQFNQGMMDLGATVCTPSRPLCPSCPLKKLCGAYSRGDARAKPSPTIRSLPESYGREIGF
jgi:A/G-specific adenine glycosylase